jgi:RNA polymerase sigma-70 factor (ECF subfamily)
VDDLTRLARDAGRGDRAALGSFIRESQAEVWRLCAHLVDPEAADDVTQETFLRAIDALPRFRGDASARTWLLQIARRTCADTIRRRTRGRAALDKARRRRPPAQRDPAGHVSLEALLHDLDADRRDAFVLTQVLGLSYQEAAEICSCPVGTIRSRVARAREQLVRAVRADHDAADDGR